MALSGIKVVDLTRYLPGPYCTFMLADYGAEVIKVEQPHEVLKKKKTFQQDKLSEAELKRIKAFELFNRNKQAVLLNLRQEAGREAVKRMVRDADVFIHDYRPGVLEKMGLGYEDLKAINPRIVYCAATLCGQTGPYRDLPGHDSAALAVSGALTRFGDGPDAPATTGAPVADILTGLHAVIGVLMAIEARHTTGEGQFVDIAMADAAFSIVSPAMGRLLAAGKEPPRSITMSNTGVWKTKDGKFVCTTDMEPAYWARFCEMVGRPDLIPRIHDRPATDKDLEAIFLKHTRAEWFDMIRANDTQGAPVLSLEEALQDEHARARGNVVETKTEDGEPILHIGPLIKLSKTPGRIRHVARMPGADTDAVLKGLGYSDQEIRELTSEGEAVA